MLAAASLSPAPFEATRQDLPHARHLPGHIYTSAEVERAEKERIFMKEWLCVGRVEELENPGDYLAIRIMNEPVLLVRTREGALKALSNVCRHRGVEVAQGQGNAKEFVCPYHAWSYDLDGRLRGVPYMRETAMDLADCRLPEFHLEVYRGWLFLNFDAQPEPIAQALAAFEETFGFLHPENCRLVAKTEFDLKCNWKFVVENLMDIYHVGTIHAKTFGHRYKGDRERYTFGLLPRGGYSFFFDAAPLTSDGQSRFGKMPWLADKPDSFACMGYLSPNVNISSRCDVMRHWVTWPLSPGESHCISYTLLPEATARQPDLQEKLADYIEHLEKVIDEDRDMVQSLQNGVGSRMFEPGPLSKLEGPIHHIMNNYLDTMRL